MQTTIGCELSKVARNDLKKALRCLLLAGITCAAPLPGPSDAQQVPPGYEGVTTLDAVQAVALSFEFTRASGIVPLSPNDITFRVDGVLTGDTFLGSTDTSSYDDQNQEEPVPQPNPEPGEDPCQSKDSRGAFGAIVNNPVDIVDGYKHMSVTDFESISNPLLQLKRYKNPRWKGQGVLGQSWITNLDSKISFSDGKTSCYPAPGKPSCSMSNPKYINFYTERGGIVQLEKDAWSAVWRGRGAAEGYSMTKGSDGKFTLQTRDSAFSPTYVFRGNGFADSVNMRDGNRLTYTYDTSNRLTRVTHNSGRYISLSWASSLPTVVASITAPNQAVYRFEYYTVGTEYVYVGVDAPILKKVIYPDGKGDTEYVHKEGTHTIYGDPRPYTDAHRLLQIRIGGTPVKNYTYSPYGSSVATSSFADGTGLYRYTYLRSGDQITREVINPHGKKTTYVIEDGKITGIEGVASANCPATFKSASYDANGMTESTINDRDVMTTYQYDGYGRKVRQVEAAGTPIQRVTRWVYDSESTNPFRTDFLKKVIVEGVSEAEYEYTTSSVLGNAMYASIVVRNLSPNGVSGQERRTTYSYTPHYNGVVATVSEDGPIPGTGDRVIKRYNSFGDLIEVENYLGHKRVFSGHNGFGQPARIVNENGDVYEYQYDARGRITVASAIVAGVAQTSRYAFDGAGRLATVTTPDNVTLTREYDVAGRVLREYQNEAGGTYAVKKYTYNNASQPTSVTVQRTTAVIGPVGTPTLSISNSSPGAYTVSWSGSSGVENYVLEEKFNSGSWISSNQGPSTSKAFSGKVAGTYAYRVTGCNAMGCTPLSAEKSLQVVYPPAAAPAVTAPVSDNDGTFTVSWSSVSTTTSYRLEQRKDAGAWSQIYSGTGLSQARSGLTNGTYEYRARACNAGGCSAYSAIKTTVVTHPPGTPTVTAPTADNDGAFAVSWGSVSTATNYRLIQRKNGGTWSQIYSGTSLSKAVSGLTNGTYDYRARGCNAGGCSAYSAIKTTVVTFPPGSAPSLSAPMYANTNESYIVYWSAVSTATSYELQSNFSGGSWSTVANTSQTSVSRSHNYVGIYGYRVRACNAGGCGPFSSTATVHVDDVGGGGPCFDGVCPEPKAVDPAGEEM